MGIGSILFFGIKTHLLQAGKAVTVSSDGNVTMIPQKLYKLVFNKKVFVSQFPLLFNVPGMRKAAGDSSFVIFTEHHPEEFAGPMPSLVTANGKEVKAAVTTDDAAAEPKTSIGVAIGGAFAVAAASFIGVILLVPGFAWLASRFDILGAIDAFASGALLALIVFIIMPESMASIATQYPKESEASAWFGSIPLLNSWGLFFFFFFWVE